MNPPETPKTQGIPEQPIPMDQPAATPPPSTSGVKTPFRATGKIVTLLVIVALVVLGVRLWRSAGDKAAPPLDEGRTMAHAPVWTAPTVMAAQPIDIAKAPLPDHQSDLLGLVRLRDVHTLPQRLTAFAGAIDPGLDAESIRTSLAGWGLDPLDCLPGGNAALFAWTPEPIFSMPPRTAAIVPVSAYAHALGSPLPPHFASFERYTLFGAEQSELDKALENRNGLQAIAQSPMRHALEASLNLRRIWETYGVVAKLQIRTAQGLAGIGLLQHPILARQPQTVQFIIELMNRLSQALLETLEQTLHLTVAIDGDAEQFTLALITESRPGTELAAANTGGPFAVPDLLSLLPDSGQALLISQETVADWTATVTVINRIVRPAVAVLGSHAEQQIDNLVNQLPACGQTTMAMQFFQLTHQPSTADAIGADYIFLAENPMALRELIETQMEQSYGTGIYASFLRLLGIDCQLTVSTSRVPGMAGDIRRYELGFVPMADADSRILPPEVVDSLSTQKAVYEIASAGPYVLMTLQRPVAKLAQQVLTEKPASRHGLFNIHPAGATAVAQVNPAPLANLIREALPVEAPIWMPDATTTDTLPPVTMAVHAQDGDRLMTVRIPTALLAALRKLTDR